jgi:hypothetical protein
MTLPYSNATSGNKAREETLKILRRFGCERLGFMDDDVAHEVVLHFEHRGRTVQLRASAKGWAAAWLKQDPRPVRTRKSPREYEQDALRQGHLAVSSILRDWVKGQITAVECGVLSFEAVFFPHMLTADGRPMLEAAHALLPKPDEPKVVQLPKAG